MKRLILLIILFYGCNYAQTWEYRYIDSVEPEHRAREIKELYEMQSKQNPRQEIRDAGCDTVRDWEREVGEEAYSLSGKLMQTITFEASKAPAWINLDSVFVYWDEWVKACYNDSTWKIWRGTDLRVKGLNSGWIHKDPNDLPGFIKFLKKKYKK